MQPVGVVCLQLMPRLVIPSVDELCASDEDVKLNSMSRVCRWKFFCGKQRNWCQEEYTWRQAEYKYV